MEFAAIIKRFNQALVWNAYLYTLSKVFSLIVTIALYNTLSKDQFCTWATVNSFIYLVLLWIDCGLNKSVPRYMPFIVRDPPFHRSWIIGIIVGKIWLLIAALPLIGILIRSVVPNDMIIIVLGLWLYGVEGIVAIIRLLYHSHFQQKWFNILSSLFLIPHTGIALLLIWHNNNNLIPHIFINAIVCQTEIMISSLVVMFATKKVIKEPARERPVEKKKALCKAFINHSLIMWITTFLKSLSERNFIVPFLNVMVGHDVASIYKVANTGALFFQRIILKTVGTSDTSFLAYALNLESGKKLMNVAFKKLIMRMSALCFPLFCLIISCVIVLRAQFVDNMVFQIFIILTISYLSETMLMPFERILEVERAYRYLGYSYSMYVIGIIILLLLYAQQFCSFLFFISWLCALQMMTLLCLAFFASCRYVSLPITSTPNLRMQTAMQAGAVVIIVGIVMYNMSWYKNDVLYFIRVVMNNQYYSYFRYT